MKRFLTTLLALVFLLSSASIALAADPDPLDKDDEQGTGGAGKVTITAEDHFMATLPTSKGFEFSVDPHGIFHMSNEDIAKLVVDPGGSGLLGEITAEKACTTVDCEEGCDDGDENLNHRDLQRALRYLR